MSTYSHESGFATNLTTAVAAGATVSFLNKMPTISPPYFLAFDATNVNGAYEVVEILSATSLSVSHAALANNHVVTEEIRQIVSAAEFDTLSAAVETALTDSTTSTLAGTIRPWPTTTAPTGYLSCTGATADRATYADLFAVIGETFGAGDGVSTFNLPDATGRVVMGRDTGDVDFDLADTGGAKTANLQHSHTANTHTHTMSATTSPSSNQGIGASNHINFASPSHTHVMTITAGTQSDRGTNNQLSATQSILMPYTTLNLIIKT